MNFYDNWTVGMDIIIDSIYLEFILYDFIEETQNWIWVVTGLYA